MRTSGQVGVVGSAPVQQPPPQPAYAPPQPSYGPIGYSVPYDPAVSASVVKRFGAMAAGTRIWWGIIFALQGAFWVGTFAMGLMVGIANAMGGNGSPNGSGVAGAILGLFIGGVLGGWLGWLIGRWLAGFVVVWMEWAQQMLAAQDALVQKS